MCSKCSGLNCNNTAPTQIDSNDDDITPTSEDINIEDTASDDEDDD